MGMQIHFRRADCEGLSISRGPIDAPDSWYIDGYGMRVEAWSVDDGLSFWFDCGSATEYQMTMIKCLILMRVCFLAS